MRRVRLLPCPTVLAPALLMMACVSLGARLPAPGSTGTSVALQVPATYAMGGACGSETSGEVSLSLLENQIAVLRQVRRDTSCAHLATTLFLGRWRVAPEGRRLTLDTGPSWLRRFDIVDRQTLRMVDSPRPEASSGTHRNITPTRLVPFRRPLELRDPVQLSDGMPFPILYAPVP